MRRKYYNKGSPAKTNSLQAADAGNVFSFTCLGRRNAHAFLKVRPVYVVRRSARELSQLARSSGQIDTPTDIQFTAQ